MSSNENVYKCNVCGEWHNDKLECVDAPIVEPGMLDSINKRLDMIEATQRCIISAILQQTAAKFSDVDCAITRRIITGDET